MFIQTELTPNPNAMKFLPGLDISPSQPIHYSSKEDAVLSPLARKLFTIGGVNAVFLGSDFITITKDDDMKWDVLKPEILVSIMDHLAASLPIFTQEKQKKEIPKQYLNEIEKQIVEIIETRVRPSVAMDGGDITYRGFKDGVVKLEMKGACSGCPSSSVTLKNGIESMLKHYIPEVESVEAFEE